MGAKEHADWVNRNPKWDILQIQYCFEENSWGVRSITVDNSEDKPEHLEFQTNSMSSNRELSKDNIYNSLFTNAKCLKNKMGELDCLVLNGDFNKIGISKSPWKDDNQWDTVLAG